MPADDRAMPVNGSGWGAFAFLRVFAGVCLTAWGAFVTLAFGLQSLSEGKGSAFALGVGLLLGGLFTAFPRSHRRGGLAALAALAVGVVLIVAGYKVAITDSGPGLPKDAEWWLHRLGGAALIALGGAAFGRLQSSDVRRWASLDQPARRRVTRIWVVLIVVAAAALTLGPPFGIAQLVVLVIAFGVAGYLVLTAEASRGKLP